MRSLVQKVERRSQHAVAVAPLPPALKSVPWGSPTLPLGGVLGRALFSFLNSNPVCMPLRFPNLTTFFLSASEPSPSRPGPAAIVLCESRLVNHKAVVKIPQQHPALVLGLCRTRRTRDQLPQPLSLSPHSLPFLFRDWLFEVRKHLDHI